MIEPMIRFYEENGEFIEEYGIVFERAFFKTEGGQLLSGSMKRMLGILFHFKWNLDLMNLSFNFKNFLLWLKKLGYPLSLPKEFLISDYVENVLQAMTKSEGLLSLQKIGKIDGLRRATGNELLRTVESYKKIVEEIGE